MTPSKPDSLHDWLQAPIGQYLLDWEQRVFDEAVSDVFGFHALQLGLPELDALQANRMPHRWLACDAGLHSMGLPREVLLTNYEALPFSDASLDLLVLPHTLELSHDPHATLSEVSRVLVPEGRVVISGFNPGSLWGLQKTWRQGPPEVGGLIAPWRLRDWLKLLSFEVQASAFGCYRPIVHSRRWLRRWAWLDKAGPRSWPILGSVYAITAVKKVRGMRLLSAPFKRPTVATAAVVNTASKGMK